MNLSTDSDVVRRNYFEVPHLSSSSLSNVVFGAFLDWSMRSKSIMNERVKALKDAHGDVLELGFGTALNLPCFPQAVTRLTMIDPEVFMPKRVSRRIVAARFPVEQMRLSAEQLPFEDGRFDCVVSTFALCTIPDVMAALHQVRRVLKPGGSFLFLEHGLSHEDSVAKWQWQLKPIQQLIGRGCHITRAIDEMIQSAGFRIIRLDHYVIEGKRKTNSTMYRGEAITT